MTPVFVMTLGDVIGLSVLALFIVGSIIYGIYLWFRRNLCSHDWREDDRCKNAPSVRGKIFLHWDCRKCGATTDENPTESKGGSE